MAYTFKHGDRPLDDYTIQRAVGRGGFGEVYYAISDGGREVALKYLRDNPEIELRGVSHCMNLKSPHLVTIFDVKQNTDGEYFIVMEYVSGPSLRDLIIAEPNGLGPQKAAFFVREIGKGLSYLHDRGIVHRDLKPGNIFYEDGYVQIGDYGLSKAIAVSRHSAQTASVGTVHYMAPEVGTGNYTRGIDIYALGVMLYEMLLGRVPFEGSSMGEVLMKHLTEQPEVDKLPEPFGKVIRKSLAKDPKDRYQTVDEMVDELMGVDDVRESVVGFNPMSLTAVAKRAAGDRMASPVPSPNPLRTPWHPDGARRGQARHGAGTPAGGYHPSLELTGKAGAKMRRIDQKIEKKLRKLGTKREKKMGAGPPPVPGAAGERIGIARISQDTVKRGLIAVIMTVGTATAVALVGAWAGSQWKPKNSDAPIFTAIMAFMSVVSISGGVVLSRWLLGAKLSTEAPEWVHRFIVIACAMPVAALACAPFFVDGIAVEQILVLLVVLAATAGFADWEDRLMLGAEGELSLGKAFKLGLFAFIAAAIFNGEEFARLAGAIAAAASLNVQALGWAFPPAGFSRVKHDSSSERSAERQPNSSQHDENIRIGLASAKASVEGLVQKLGSGQAAVAAVLADFDEEAVRASGKAGNTAVAVEIPAGIPVDRMYHDAQYASNEPLPPLRWGVTRVFWSLISFGAICGSVTLFILCVLENFTHAEDQTLAIGGCVAAFSLFLFAARKTTLRRRFGFWRETLRPFLQSAALTMLGFAIASLATGFASTDDEIPVAVVGIVFSSLCTILLLFVPGRRRHRPVYEGAAPDWNRQTAGASMDDSNVRGGHAPPPGREEGSSAIGVGMPHPPVPEGVDRRAQATDDESAVPAADPPPTIYIRDEE